MRASAAVAAVLLAVTVLGGCGGGDAERTTDGAGRSAEPPSTSGRSAGRAAEPPSTSGRSVTPPAPPSTSGRSAAPPAPRRPGLPADLDVAFAGKGAQGAWVLRRRGSTEDPVVLFLHGWTAVSPTLYGPWLAHLVRRGSTVVYPVYQDAPFLAPDEAFAGVVAGVRAALSEERLPRTDWVVAGHSAGGSMSADYAASAERLGLPAARGVFSAYPGRRLRGIPLELPEVDPAQIPRSTRLVALYGTDDTTVGDVTAKRTVARARTADEQLVRVADPAVSDHLGPQRSGPATRRVFWRRLDALIAAVRTDG